MEGLGKGALPAELHPLHPSLGAQAPGSAHFNLPWAKSKPSSAYYGGRDPPTISS